MCIYGVRKDHFFDTNPICFGKFKVELGSSMRCQLPVYEGDDE